MARGKYNAQKHKAFLILIAVIFALIVGIFLIGTIFLSEDSTSFIIKPVINIVSTMAKPFINLS